jgi:hypothetical protein
VGLCVFERKAAWFFAASHCHLSLSMFGGARTQRRTRLMLSAGHALVQASPKFAKPGDHVPKKTSRPHPVSASNPCPFLRALVATGKLSDAREPLTKVAAVVAATAQAGDGAPVLPREAIYAIGSVANGLSPLALLDTQWRGMQLNALRGGPLDKQGAGSGLLNAHGAVDPRQVARLKGFAKEQLSDDGLPELGLGLSELRAYMDANFARAAGHRRYIDRALMLGEWPVLLRVMGKPSAGGRYLSLEDIITLFTHRRFPERMNKRMDKGPNKHMIKSVTKAASRGAGASG